jgi:tyrosine-protein kinase Etk/Wzc
VSYMPFDAISAPVQDERGQLSWRAFLRLMRDHVLEVVGIAAIIVTLALAYVSLATRIYSADVLVRVDPPDPNELGIDSQNRESVPPSPSPAAEMAVMASRSVLEPVIQQYRFDISVTPRSVPVLGALAEKFASPGQLVAPWLGLSSFAWGGEQVEVASLEVPQTLVEEKLKLVVLDGGDYELRGPSNEHLLWGKVGEPASASDGASMLITRLVARPGTQFQVIRWSALDAVKRFMDSLKITDKVKDTGLVEITYSDKYPARAAGVANALSLQYIASAVATHQRADSATLAFITKELPRLRKELERTEEALSDDQASSQSLQPTSEAQAYLQGGIQLDMQVANLQMQRTQLLERFTPDSRWVVNIDTQLKQLDAARNALNARFASMPVSERRNVDLTREAKVAETIYLGMVQKAEELSVRRASTTGGAHIVDDAIAPFRPVRPDPLLIIPGSVVLGLLCGAFFVFIRRHVMTGVTDPLYVERRLSVPVLGEVLFSQHQVTLSREMAAIVRSRLASRGRTAELQLRRLASHRHRGSLDGVAALSDGASKVLAERFPGDPSIEALRSVRTALSRDLARARNNVVMLTGPTPAAGKSFVAANLAVLHAETGARVLLIDADMRGGQLAYFFDQANPAGLSDVLKGEMQPREAVRKVDADGLSLISCGNRAENPAGLLMKSRFKEMLRCFSEEFDLVVVDTPPFLMVTDAEIIAGEAGATILVLRSGMQSESEIVDTLKKLERSEARVVGAIFNAIPVRRNNRYYGYASRSCSNNQLEITA